ncbi:MarR family winged helix-turn-helix transcriptional regulator [Atopobium fossor]|uniref:MarR family winged helix-turn-helix transcriptional regulator n=1 Tax=Atopobium fossor TaxID=39487 RepID=UPI00040BE1BE|nr:MarR family transcriptional regulator [Atopobium fossor]
MSQSTQSIQPAQSERFETFSSLISALNKEVQRLKKTEMARFGLQGTDAMCLVCLAKHPKGIPSADIARAIGVDRALVSRSLASLMQKGYAQAQQDHGVMGYRSPVLLTKKGRELGHRIEEVINRMVGLAADDLAGEDIVVMYRVLKQVLAKIKVL